MLRLCQSQGTSCGVQGSFFFSSSQGYLALATYLRSELTASNKHFTPPGSCFRSWIPNHSCSRTLTSRTKRLLARLLPSQPNPWRTPKTPVVCTHASVPVRLPLSLLGSLPNNTVRPAVRPSADRYSLCPCRRNHFEFILYKIF